MYKVFILILLAGLTSCHNNHEPMEEERDFNPSVEVGIVTVDITPDEVEGIEMSGYTSRTATGLHDPITVRILIIDDHTEEIALIAFDFSDIDYTSLFELAPFIEEHTGISKTHMFVHANHTHSGIIPSYFIEPENLNPFMQKLVQGILTAKKSKVEAQIQAASGPSTASIINRRHPERKITNVITALYFEDSKFNTVATLINFACHPVVLGPDNRIISADYIYYLRKKVEKELGGQAIFFSGSLGDINPAPINSNRYERTGGTFKMAEHLGSTLAQDVIDLHKDADVEMASIKLLDEEFTMAERLTRISVVDFGNIQIMTIPGEPLSGFQEMVEPLLDGPHKLFFGLTHYKLGYLIPEEEWGTCAPIPYFPGGCYEETDTPGRDAATQLYEKYKTLTGN